MSDAIKPQRAVAAPSIRRVGFKTDPDSELSQRVQNRLEQISYQGLYRHRAIRHLHESFQGNDYLGLSQHPSVLKIYKDALDQSGTGSGGSPLITGYSLSHQKLESELAEWLGTESVVLFSSGFVANCGLIEVLESLNANFYVDRLCHASVYSYLKAQRVRVSRFAHNDAAHLKILLNKPVSDSGQRLNVVSTEGLFSMDGDSAPLTELAEVCDARTRNDTVLHIDDAHALGCIGEQGRGSVSELQTLNVNFQSIITGTFGKAFGQHGAFIGCSKAVAELIVNQCRHYIYSTSFCPAQAEALREALRIIRGNEGDALRAKLERNIHTFRKSAEEHGLPLMASKSAIQPLLLGSSENAMAVSARLSHQGITVNPIRPPTVPQGQCRIRITLSAVHHEKQIKHQVGKLARAMENSNA